MEQKPVPGQQALVPPDAETARQFLVAADAVVERRARTIDRRSLARLQIANAAITAGFLVASAALFRTGAVTSAQALLFTFIMWGQLAGGMAQRSGMTWRMTRARWPVLLGGGIVLASAMIGYGFAVWDHRMPDGFVLLPGVIILLGFGGCGVVRLVRASGDPARHRATPVPLSGGQRAGTALVGASLGLLTILAAAPGDVTRAVLILVLMLALLAWLMASNSERGLPAIGASWRWPHVLVFMVSAAVPVVLALTATTQVLVSVLAGATVIVLFAAVSFVPGRERS